MTISSETTKGSDLNTSSIKRGGREPGLKCPLGSTSYCF